MRLFEFPSIELPRHQAQFTPQTFREHCPKRSSENGQDCSEQRLYGLLGGLGSAHVHLQRETDSVEHVFRNHEANRLLGINHLADTYVGHKREQHDQVSFRLVGTRCK